MPLKQSFALCSDYNLLVKTLVICKMNQIRSPFAASLLAAYFPEHHFASAGVFGVTGVPVNDLALQVLEKWGIASTKSISQNLRDLGEDFGEFNLIITSEPGQKISLSEIADDQRIIDFSDGAISKLFIPIDPIGFYDNRSLFEIELAKVSHCALRVFSKNFTPISSHRIFIVTPFSADRLEEALTRAIEISQDIGGVIIDSDLRAPLREVSDRDIDVEYFDFRNLLAVNISEINKRIILTSQVECLNPEEKLLSFEWRDFVTSILAQTSIVILTAPLRSKSRSYPDAYLASCLGDEIEII